MKKWIVVVLLFLTVWAFYIEPRRITVRNLQITPSGWPQHVDTIRTAIVSDLHVGSTVVNLERLSEVVQLINQQDPDLILLGGDYVATASPGGEIVPLSKIAHELSKLKAPLGVVAVLGNHDWWLDGELVRDEFEKVGIVVLENQVHHLQRENGALWVAGIADDITRSPDVDGTLRKIPDDAPVIILTHDPAQFMDVPKGPYLTISGHTHGGQVYLPFLGALMTPSRAPMEWIYGHIKEEGRDLYVTSGIGTSILPVRFNMPPEIVVIDIGQKIEASERPLSSQH